MSSDFDWFDNSLHVSNSRTYSCAWNTSKAEGNHLWKFRWMMINGLFGVCTAELESLINLAWFPLSFFQKLYWLWFFFFSLQENDWLWFRVLLQWDLRVCAGEASFKLLFMTQTQCLDLKIMLQFFFFFYILMPCHLQTDFYATHEHKIASLFVIEIGVSVAWTPEAM